MTMWHKLARALNGCEAAGREKTIWTCSQFMRLKSDLSAFRRQPRPFERFREFSPYPIPSFFILYNSAL
jgi:hypothetical protein